MSVDCDDVHELLACRVKDCEMLTSFALPLSCLDLRAFEMMGSSSLSICKV